MTASTPARPTAIDEIGAAGRHSAVYSIGSILAKVMGFMMLPLFTRYLTPSDYGIFELVELSMTVLATVLGMGIAPALLRSYAAAPTQRLKDEVVSTIFIFVSCTGIAVYFCAMLFMRPLSAAILGPAVSPKYLMLSFTSFALSYIAAPVRIYLRALEASNKIVLLDTATTALVLVLNVTLLAGMKLGLVAVLLSPIIVNALWIVLAIAILSRLGFHFNPQLLRAMMKFGLPLILSYMAAFVLNFADRFFLQHYQNLTAVGLYAMGYKFGFMLAVLLVQPFGFMWQSRMYAIHANPDYQAIFQQIFVLYSTVLTYAALGLALLAREIFHFAAGPAFSSAADVIAVIALAYVFSGVGSYLQTGMYLANRTGWVGAISGISALASIAFYWLLIPRYGSMGAGWATVLSFAGMAAASYWKSQKVCPLYFDLRRVGLGMILAAAVYGVCVWRMPQSILLSLALKAVALLGFPVLLAAVGVIGPSERAVIRGTAATFTARLYGRSGSLAAASRGAHD